MTEDKFNRLECTYNKTKLLFLLNFNHGYNSLFHDNNWVVPPIQVLHVASSMQQGKRSNGKKTDLSMFNPQNGKAVYDSSSYAQQRTTQKYKLSNDNLLEGSKRVNRTSLNANVFVGVLCKNIMLIWDQHITMVNGDISVIVCFWQSSLNGP